MNWFQRQIQGVLNWKDRRNYRGDYTTNEALETDVDVTSIHIHKATNGHVIELYGQAKSHSVLGHPERGRTLWVVGTDDSLTDSVVKALVVEKLSEK
jgi:hypothetical protein